jgi:proteasome lid subunit RPN8/RPN11
MTSLESVRSTIDWKDTALKAAKEVYPRESCGLLLLVKGKQKYWPCKNIAKYPEQMFQICPIDYAKGEELGEVIAVVHSHPVASPAPSEADKVAASKGKIPWYIVNPKLEQWATHIPKGSYISPLLGRKWVWAVQDCWTLVRDWYQQEGLALRDWERPSDPEQFIKSPMFDGAFGATGFRMLKDEKLIKGDALLMSIGSSGLNHCAVYLGDGNILHHLQNRLSCRDCYGEWLQSCTGKKLRHADSQAIWGTG